MTPETFGFTVLSISILALLTAVFKNQINAALGYKDPSAFKKHNAAGQD